MSPADSISYRVIFDVAEQIPAYWWLVGIPLIIIAVGIAIFRKKEASPHRAFVAFFVGFAIFLALLHSIVLGRKYAVLRSALARGDYERVEGVVTGFLPEDSAKKSREQFVVVTPTGRHEYAYSWSIVSMAFNGGPFYQGLLHDGMRVRIADVDGKIARLEVSP